MTASVLRLKNVARVGGGQSPPSDEVTTFEGEGLPFLQGNAEFGSDHPRPRNRCDAPPRVAPAGSILMSVRAPVGALNWADRDYGIGRGLCSIVPTKGEARYVWWALQAAVPALRSVATGSTFEAVAVEDVAGVFLPAHDERVQRRITDFLDYETARIDALIAVKQRMISAAQARLLATQHWSHQQSTIEGQQIQIRRVFARRQDETLPDDPVVTAFRDGQVTSRNLRRSEGYTVSFTEQGYQRVEVGDLVFHGLDGFAGACGVAETAGKCSGVYHVCVPSPDVLSEFSAIQLQVLAQSGFVALQASSVRERAVDLRNWERFGTIPIPIPTLETQRDHVARVASARSFANRMTTTLATQIELLRERRQALITAAGLEVHIGMKHQAA